MELEEPSSLLISQTRLVGALRSPPLFHPNQNIDDGQCNNATGAAGHCRQAKTAATSRISRKPGGSDFWVVSPVSPREGTRDYRSSKLHRGSPPEHAGMRTKSRVRGQM